MSNHYVYILASKKNGTLYIGVTTDLKKRIWQHKEKIIDGFTKDYDVKLLVYFEHYQDYWDAANRERRMKSGTGSGKSTLLKKKIPNGKICTINYNLYGSPPSRGCF